jgi:hypothetical protein
MGFNIPHQLQAFVSSLLARFTNSQFFGLGRKKAYKDCNRHIFNPRNQDNLLNWFNVPHGACVNN